MATEVKYPLPVFHFQVKVGDEEIPFSEVSGLTIETQLIEYRDGSSPEYSSLKMSGIPKYSNITLKRGIIAQDSFFFTWINNTSLNKPDRRDITISLLNEEHSPVMVWKVKRAWPVKVEGPGLKATGNEVAIESIELAHEGLTIEAP
jgi:phage tail-like protein